MTVEQYKKREKAVNLLSMGMLGVLILFLAFCAWRGLADTAIFPVGIGGMLLLHWFFSDVLPVKWLNMFEGKEDDQKKSYCVYAAMELIGFAGLTYFLIDMGSTTGAIVYVATMFLKKKFLEDFRGVKPEEAEEDEVAEVQENDSEQVRQEAPVIELEIPEVRATEEDLIAQTQMQSPEEQV